VTLSAHERDFLAKRSTLTDNERKLVSLTLDNLEFYAKADNIPLRKDDSLARLEASLIRYLLDCKGEDTSVAENGFPALQIDDVLWKDKPMHQRAKNERRVVYGLLNHLLAAGFIVVSVYDGEEHEYPTDAKGAMEIIFNLDESYVWVSHVDYVPHKRMISLVLGNADDGSEVVADWSFGAGDPDGFDAAMQAFKAEDFV
jgi:hypothetical protein